MEDASVNLSSSGSDSMCNSLLSLLALLFVVLRERDCLAELFLLLSSVSLLVTTAEGFKVLALGILEADLVLTALTVDCGESWSSQVLRSL